MTVPAHELTDDELQALTARLGVAVTRGELARETAIGDLLDQADGGLTPVGAAEMIDHYDYDLPDYREAFEDLVGTVDAFAAMSPAERTGHAWRLLLISLNSENIKDLGRDVTGGRTTRGDAITALQALLDLPLTTEDAGRLVDGWATTGLRHSRALRYLNRLYTNDALFPTAG